jgi:hypothetical protein
MYFVPLTGKPVDVTDEVLEQWAEEEQSRLHPSAGEAGTG